MLRLLLPWAVFVSAHEVERADAFKRGYLKVCQHPNEVGALDGVKLLVIDSNQILFDDHALAIGIANEAARRCIIVGVHTYDPESLKLYRLAKLPNVLVAKTHRRLLHDVRRYAKLRARPRRKLAKAAKPLKGTVNHVPNHNDPNAGAGIDTSVPAKA